MADNIVLNPGSGGDSLTAQDVGSGVKLPRHVQVCHNATFVTPVAGTTSSTTLLAANTSRVQAVIWNDSTAVLYVKVGASGASSTSFTWIVAPGGYLELPSPVYTGIIYGVWSFANGNARLTEFTF